MVSRVSRLETELSYPLFLERGFLSGMILGVFPGSRLIMGSSRFSKNLGVILAACRVASWDLAFCEIGFSDSEKRFDLGDSLELGGPTAYCLGCSFVQVVP